MARKKKTAVTVAATTDIEQAKVGYQGAVKVAVLKGKRVINSKVYKNEGRWPLFYNISLSLAGNYKEAERFRPKFLKMFQLGIAGDNIPAGIPVFGSLPVTSLNDVLYNNTIDSNYVIGTSTTVVEDYSTATLKFLIPFSQIDTTKYTNLIALYSSTYKKDNANPCAYIIIADENNPNLLGNLGPSTQLDNENDYNLYIEWSMKVQNN